MTSSFEAASVFASASLEALASPQLLTAAWDRVYRRRAAPGVDGVTVHQYAASWPARLKSLAIRLRSGEWRPHPARRLSLPDDPDRPIAVASVEDRIVHRAMADLLQPLAEAAMDAGAWAYRPGRSVDGALEEVSRHLALGRRWFVRTDVEKFFDRIDRELLLSQLTTSGLDDRLVALVWHLLDAGVVQGRSWFEPEAGTPQGSALSPLLANLYLHPLDAAMRELGHAYLRYADDILVLTETEGQAGDALLALNEHVQALSLRLGGRKTERGHVAGGFVFLGARFDGSGRGVSRRAHAALAERMSSLLAEGDVEPALGLLADFTRWYGALRHSDLTDSALWGASILSAHRKSDAHSVLALAPLRAGIALLPMAADVHVAIAETAAANGLWELALVEARTALAGPAAPALQQRLAAALVLSVEQLGAVACPWDRAASRFGEAGRLELAQAAKKLMVPAPKRAGVRLAPPSDAQVQMMLQTFANPRAPHMVADADKRGHWQLGVVKGPIDAERIHQHLAGDRYFAVCPLRADASASLAVLNVRVRAEARRLEPKPGDTDVSQLRARQQAALHRGLDHAAALASAARKHDVIPLVEQAEPYHWRLWFLFSNPVQLRHLHALLRIVAAQAGAPAEGVAVDGLPKTDSLQGPESAHAALPLGVSPWTGARSQFLDDDLRPITDPWSWLQTAPRIDPKLVLKLVMRGPLAQPARAVHERPEQRALQGVGDGQAILRGCALLAAIAAKSLRLGVLEPDERHSLFETFGFLPHGRAADALVAIGLGSASQVTRRLSSLTQAPISCAKLKQRHVALLPDHPCNCAFTKLEAGLYPSPVLHALDPRQIPFFADRLPAGRAPTPQPAAVAALKENAVTPAAPAAPLVSSARPPTGDGPRRGVNAALAKWLDLRGQQAELEAQIATLRQDLLKMLREEGTSRLLTPYGTLVCTEEGGQERLVLEL